MPFVEIDGAQLYYETFGEDAPGRAPIVLIHGSTETGRSNWGLVAPLLARSYRVIVPDCRGHGSSTSPDKSYSFRQMADDTAALIHALGYQRAHVIGHSNGGNVALVVLLEHPEVVQTAVIQAANAYVSPDLLEKEPAVFDPERVAREAPDWMQRMIALHGATHGADYWRELLRLTLAELLANPNYTAADLAAAGRPALVIQGQRDHVNAPARHAQFIAGHIPDAELWVPEGLDHNVHDEALFAWVERVLDFLARRGEDANDALYRLRRARYADSREWVFDVRAGTNGAGEVSLSGSVLTPEQRQAMLGLFSGNVAQEQVRVLLDRATPWALVVRPVADLRRAPRSLAERLSQIRFGEAVRVLDERDGWAFVRLERDGYLGWTPSAALHRCAPAAVEAYAAASNALVTAELAVAHSADPAALADQPAVAGKLPFGVDVAVEECRAGWARLRLPNGARWWCAEADILPLAERPAASADGIARALALIERFVGVPYLWGGRSPFGYDCSGLAQTFLGLLGIQAPRDADQQFQAGAPAAGPYRPGDLLFFGEKLEDPVVADGAPDHRSIRHVAISLGGDMLIHANGSAGGISYNSLDPASPLFRPWLRDELAGARRFI